ncbi:uncharacterized protein LOC144163646 [Haemaphysalis longicornis]
MKHGADTVMNRISDRYLPTTFTEHHGPYRGLPNGRLDRDIDVEEVHTALQDLNSRSAAGPDRITNKDYLEREGLYPATMIGFRQRLSTQDAMLQLKNGIVDDTGISRDNKTILGLDLQSAFDKVKHSAILSQVSKLNMGERSYSYVKDFLTDRTTELRAGDIQLQDKKLGSTGTPQGSDRQARKVGVRHTIYADDITIWTTGGSDSQIEAKLQDAVNAIEDHLDGSGLVCSPSNQRREHEKIKIVTRSGQTIPEVSKIRVLGMIIEKHRRNGETVARLTAKAADAMRLVRRITFRKAGMKEDSLIRLVQSFVASHIAYVAAYHNWLEHERNKINAIIRKAYKSALGLFESTSTSRFLKLGVHNTLEEIAEAQRTAQLERLSTTKAGRKILEDLGL